METKTLLTKEVQENFFNEMRNEYQPWLEDEEPELSVDEFAIILKRNSINIFAQAMRHAELAKGCHSLMKEVTNLEMLVVYYSMVDGSAPEGFWDNLDATKLLKDNLEVIKKVNYLTFSTLHKFEKLRKFILINGYLSECDEDVLIELSKKQASPLEFEAAKQVFSHWTSEQKCAELIKLNPELVLQMTGVVPETTLIKAALMAQNTEVLLKAFEGNCSDSLVSGLVNELIEYPDFAAVMDIISKNHCVSLIWKKLINLRKIDLIVELLNNRKYKFPALWEDELLNMDNYTINRAYLNQHALQISTHESCLFDVENREEMEKLVTWYNKKYGFREKYAQGLWDNMQRKKLNTFIKRLKFLFGY